MLADGAVLKILKRFFFSSDPWLSIKFRKRIMYEKVFKALESFSVCSVEAVPFCAKHFSIH